MGRNLESAACDILCLHVFPNFSNPAGFVLSLHSTLWMTAVAEGDQWEGDSSETQQGALNCRVCHYVLLGRFAACSSACVC